MQLNFTLKLLIKYLYNETTKEETIAINNALATDEALQEEFSQLQAAKYALNDEGGNMPRKSVIQTILAYSKEKSAEEVI